jgi:hypothetical protein
MQSSNITCICKILMVLWNKVPIFGTKEDWKNTPCVSTMAYQKKKLFNNNPKNSPFKNSSTHASLMNILHGSSKYYTPHRVQGWKQKLVHDTWKLHKFHTLNMLFM